MIAKKRRAGAIVALLLGSAITGCGSAARSSVAPTALQQASVAPVATSTPGPAATGPREPCPYIEGFGSVCLMDAGDYRSTTFRGGVSFTLATDWNRTNDLLGPDAGQAPDVILLHRGESNFGTIVWLGIFGGPVLVGPVLVGPNTPATTVVEFIAALDAIEGLTITSVEGRDFGAHVAKVYDVENESAGFPDLFRHPTSNVAYSLAQGDSARVYWLDIDGAPVLVTLEAPTEHFAAFLEQQEPFLASIRFGT